LREIQDVDERDAQGTFEASQRPDERAPPVVEEFDVQPPAIARGLLPITLRDSR